MELYLEQLGIACALGNCKTEVADRLFRIKQREQSLLRTTDSYSPGRPFALGFVDADLPGLADEYAAFKCRNNSMLQYCAMQIQPRVKALAEQFGADRIGVVLATSTSGIEEAEKATAQRLARGALPDDFHFLQQQLSGGTDFLSHYLNVSGPTTTISTACSSSANALASATRLIRQDLCDAVIVGGVDTLTQFTVQGFAALEALSKGLANPFSVNRDGINIGEGGALMVMSREPTPIRLLAVGNSSDAYHISAPHPEGKGAEQAMREALQVAGLRPEQINYVNLHGTGTAHNDLAEGHAIARVLGPEVSCSSSKPLTGHTLGAAGIIEAALCWLSMHPDYNPSGSLIAHLWDGQTDPDIEPLNLVDGGVKQEVRPKYCLSNSFAFGGNNACVILGVSDHETALS